jgi:hypothetical protein
MEQFTGTVTAGKRTFPDIEIWIEITSGPGLLRSWHGVFHPGEYINSDTHCRLVLDDGRSGEFTVTATPIGPSYATKFQGTGPLE